MNNKKFSYLGYLISVIALVPAFIFKENRTIEITSIFIFAICLSITYVQLTHYKMMKKDKDYRISVNDERAEKTRV